MNDSADDARQRVHALAVRQLDGALSIEQQGELVAILTESSAARRTYAQHMYDTASLRWIFSGRHHRQIFTAGDHAVERMEDDRWRYRAAVLFGLALAAALAAVAAWPMFNDPTIATVTAASAVEWGEQKSAAPMLSRVAVGQKFDVPSGTLELTFDSGVQLRAFAPATFEVSSPRSIFCSRGRVKTLVGENGKGFTIDTPRARIVDLGTEFGVNISDQGDTQVVVFQGAVDLEPPATGPAGRDDPLWNRTLQQGDALQVSNSGRAERLMAVQRSDFFPSAVRDPLGGTDRPAILDVRDNLRDGQSNKCYQIVHRGLWEDAPSFVDRSHEWNGVASGGIPAYLRGADYVMPFNDDKFIADLQVEVQIACPATCYVFLDQNMKPPAWLKKDFHRTGEQIGLDASQTIWHKDNRLAQGAGKSVDFVFDIWVREVPQAGVVRFGGVEPPKVGTRSLGFNMYGIAVAPR